MLVDLHLTLKCDLIILGSQARGVYKHPVCNISLEIYMEQKIVVIFGGEFVGSGHQWEGGSPLHHIYSLEVFKFYNICM